LIPLGVSINFAASTVWASKGREPAPIRCPRLPVCASGSILPYNAWPFIEMITIGFSLDPF
jgi:hypothetical protein